MINTIDTCKSRVLTYIIYSSPKSQSGNIIPALYSFQAPVREVNSIENSNNKLILEFPRCLILKYLYRNYVISLIGMT